MSFPRYAKYKASGVEWLGDVPEHWEVAPAKWHLRSASGGNSIKGHCADEPAEGLYPAFSASGQDVWLESYDFNIPGIVLSAVGARCGKTFKANGAWGVVANTHCLFPIQNSGRDFFWYLTNQEDWWEKGGSAQPFVKVSDTLARKWVFPPLPEQIHIAAFLDRETAKIDELVAEQRRLMELLKEKRQALISHAVTRGLNSAAPLKPSGIEWLGDVPAHWDVSRIKYYCAIKGRIGFRGYTTADQVDEGSGALTLGATHITSSGEINIDEPVYISWEKYYESPEIMVSPKHILVVQRGSTCGKVGFVAANLGPATINPSLVLLKDFSCSPRLLFHYLSSTLVQGLFACVLGSTAIPMLSQEQIGDIALCLPPLNEQDAIVTYIDEETAKLDTLTAEAQRAIDLLQERRTALISAAVTGQVDVRPLLKKEAA